MANNVDKERLQSFYNICLNIEEGIVDPVLELDQE